jgi:hypothetical protein
LQLLIKLIYYFHRNSRYFYQAAAASLQQVNLQFCSLAAAAAAELELQLGCCSLIHHLRAGLPAVYFNNNSLSP